MSTDKQEPVAQPVTSGVSQDSTQKDSVSYETYLKVLGEAKKTKERLKALEDQASQAQEKTLADQNEWKKLAETYKTKLSETTKTLKQQEESIVNGMKYQEFTKALGGTLKSDDYATFIPFEKISFNPDTKSVDGLSVKSAVEEFMAKHSGLVNFGSGRMPNVNSTTGTSYNKEPSQMTTQELENELRKLGNI